MPNPPTLTLRLSQPDGITYRLDLEGPDVGERRGKQILDSHFASWYHTCQAISTPLVGVLMR